MGCCGDRAQRDALIASQRAPGGLLSEQDGDIATQDVGDPHEGRQGHRLALFRLLDEMNRQARGFGELRLRHRAAQPLDALAR